jgi:Cdc6-like AAA superfamily ATPase
MKGPNPFAPWLESPEDISGKKDESRIFNAFANGTSSRQAGVMVVTGGSGAGKSALMQYLRHEAEKAGLVCPYVQAEKGEDEKALVEKIYAEITTLSETKRREGFPRDLPGLVSWCEKAVKLAFGAIIFIDDLDRMRKAESVVKRIAGIAKSGWGKRKISFVLSSTREFGVKSDLFTYVKLRPFDEHDMRELLDKALKKGPPKMGDECVGSIMADSGGNPRLVTTVCRIIYERLRDTEKVITKGHYLAYLPQIMSALSREWFGGMYQETPEAERAILQVLARNEEGMHVSDIAKALNKDLGPVTALTKRLLERGQIVRVDRGKYRMFSKLYGKYVVSRS